MLSRSSIHSTRKKTEEEIRPNKIEDQEKDLDANNLPEKEEKNKAREERRVSKKKEHKPPKKARRIHGAKVDR